MNDRDYSEKALKTISTEFASVKPDLIHGIVGLASEAGELAGLLEKMHFYPSKKITREMIIDECGDCLWYLSLVLESVGSSLTEAKILNVAKLDVRWNKNKGEKIRAEESKIFEQNARLVSKGDIDVVTGDLKHA